MKDYKVLYLFEIKINIALKETTVIKLCQLCFKNQAWKENKYNTDISMMLINKDHNNINSLYYIFL